MNVEVHWLSEVLLETLRGAERIHRSVVTQWSPSASIFLAMSGKQIIDQWMFCAVQKPYLLILANLQEINSTIFPSTFRLHASLSTWNFPFLKKKSRKLFTFLSFLNQSSCITSYNIYRFICQIDRLEPELRVRWEKTLKLNLLDKRRNF